MVKTTGIPEVNFGYPDPIGNIVPNTGEFTELIVGDLVATTLVSPNIDANTLDGTDWRAPGTIGAVTPGDGYFSQANVNTTNANPLRINSSAATSYNEVYGSGTSYLLVGHPTTPNHTLAIQWNDASNQAFINVSNSTAGIVLTPTSTNFNGSTQITTLGDVTPGTGYFGGLDCSSGGLNATIGVTTPNSGKFTTLGAGSVFLNSGVSVQGVYTNWNDTATGSGLSGQAVFNNHRGGGTGGFDFVSYNPAGIKEHLPLKISVDGQGTFLNSVNAPVINSTIATGTAPLTVSSTTKVSNLNADLLDGGDWGTPGPIGDATPSTGRFTSLNTGGPSFGYSEGTWSPIMQYVEQTVQAKTNPSATLSISKQEGTYVKIGRMVRVEFSLVFSMIGGADFAGSYRFPVLSGLPFRNDGGRVGGSFATMDYPNGYTLMLPAPLISVFPGSKGIDFPSFGDPVGRIVWFVAPLTYPDWIADGYTIFVESEINAHVPLLDTYSATGFLHNGAYLTALVPFNVEFTGNITYITNG
jgi:hypothetical protein